MTGYVTDLKQETLANEAYRRVLVTGRYLQLVLMTLRPTEEIGAETHDDHDQFIWVESGVGKILLGQQEHPLSPGIGAMIPAGINHNVVNTSVTHALRLYTLYSPPEHTEGTMHHTKADE
jgi:mannose-6-phosphate isomerase-like protein (cupin superfamily)